jgi:TRAP-type C4-dicarboxylate transport system substrate-binding protein
MRRRAFLSALAASGVQACVRRDRGGIVTLTYASPYSPSHPFSRADIAWMKFVERESDGRLRIKPYWAGVISSEASMMEIRHGLVDIGLITPIYTRGGAHAQRTQTGFYGGVRAMQDQIDVYRCLAQEFPALRRELDGLRVLAVQAGNFPGVLTRSRPIEAITGFRGLRLRAPTEILPVLKELGADPVNLPMGEVYSALAKNVIDGVVAPTDAIRSLHFNEVARFFTYARFPRGAYPARAMAEASWLRLPAELQAIMKAGTKIWEDALISELQTAQERGAAFGRENGMTFTRFPAADQQRLDAIYLRWAERSAVALAHEVPEGVRMFTRAQELIAARNRGAAALCAAEGA